MVPLSEAAGAPTHRHDQTRQAECYKPRLLTAALTKLCNKGVFYCLMSLSCCSPL